MTLSICIIYINVNNINESTSYQFGGKMKSSATDKGRVVPVYAMKEYRGSRGINPIIFTSALDKIEWSTSRPDCFNPEIELR
jgi:hypothetical protein